HTRFSRDWSSDVCSSDLGLLLGTAEQPLLIESCGASDGGPEPPPEVLATSTRASEAENPAPTTCLGTPIRNGDGETVGLLWAIKIGRASCRERVERAGCA